MKKSVSWIAEKPLTMLKQVVRSVIRRRCSRDCNFVVASRSSYGSRLKPGRRFVNERCTASMESIR